MTAPDHADRLFIALSIGEEAGLKRGAMLPPLLRLAGRLGLPVKPLHFMTLPELIAALVPGMVVVLTGTWWVFLTLSAGDAHPTRYVRLFRLIDSLGGLPLMVALSVLVGLVWVGSVRSHARALNLPDWRAI